MRKRLICAVLLGGVMAFTALYTRKVLASPATGFASTTIALGRLGDIDVINANSSDAANPWVSLQRTKGASDLYVQNNLWDPLGSTGWHTHPGHSLIVVTSGNLTAYEGDDPACKATVYTPGMAFFDPGGDHVHLIRNEGRVQATTITVQLIPANAARRIDAPSPGNCGF